MNVTTISRSLLGGLLSAIVILQPASAAGTLSGQIGVQVTLGSGCSVSNVRNGENNRWGNINFGSYGDLANSIDAEITGSGGGSALTVTCTEDLASTLTLDGGTVWRCCAALYEKRRWHPADCLSALFGCRPQ
ncbi:spore coat protein U domain-containing protein [Klebsiella michiganensis]|nr:spore coat protein U domain-containing protein [Klebsiella michiganensis]